MFTSHRDYWIFARSVRSESRLLRSPEQQQFLGAVREGLASRAQEILYGSAVWRAAVGHTWRYEQELGCEVEAAYDTERLMPLKDRAVEGRANPKGIPCFYCATRQETAIAEVRPWIGSYVSVGQFEVVKRLKIVNLVTDRSLANLIWLDCEPAVAEVQERVWQDIDVAFTEPVERHDDVADYVSTQIIAELIRSSGFDGIAYGSRVGPGHNIALFDLAAVEHRSGHLFRVEDLQVKASECDNPYYLKKDT